MAKGKLHQLLAVEPDIKGLEEKVRKEAIKTFKDKTSHFDGLVQEFKSNEENGTDVIDEQKHVVTTVSSKLKYTQKSIIKLLDFTYQKELANTNAKADLVIENKEGDPTIIAKDIPATVLLNFESRLKDIRSIYDAIPTCDPSKVWKENPSETDQYITDIEKKFRTRKTPKVIVKYEATKEHPAQTELINVDNIIGEIQITHKSGRMTPADKSKLLEKIDTLIQATKQARQRANDVEVDAVKIGKEIFNYIHG